MNIAVHAVSIKSHRVHHPDVEAVLALARDKRGELKQLAKLCRELERNRYTSDRDKRCINRMRHTVSDMLALLRGGARS